MIHHVPGGFAYADQMLTEAGLADPLSQVLEPGDEALWLRQCVSYLDRRFQRWLRVQLIEPLSLPGLFRVLRYRIRSYPTFILGPATYSGRNLEELELFIRRQARTDRNSADLSGT
jgi:hypothetical protein